MRTLKIVFLTTLSAFFVIASVGILIAIHENSNLFRDRIYLTCSFERSDSVIDKVTWTLEIIKGEGTVLWNGWEGGKKREVEYIADSALRMKWLNDDGEKVFLDLNRLNGQFEMRLEHKEKPLRQYGECYERAPRF